MLVVCGGRGVGAGLSRTFTVGWRHAFRRDSVSHVGLTVDVHSSIFLAEARADLGRVVMTPFSWDDRRILRVRAPLTPLSDDALSVIQGVAVRDVHRGVRYDYPGAVSFAVDWAEQEPNELYCSEAVYRWTRMVMPYPDKFEFRVSPHDMDGCKAWSGRVIKR